MTACPAHGSIAVVAYVPEWLAAPIRRISANLLNAERDPHVTLLPPRPLSGAPDEILPALGRILSDFLCFHVGLEQVTRFPETEVVYLNIEEGREPIHRLHAALADAAPPYRDPFQFLPHLTLGGPATEQDIVSVAAQWNALAEEHRFFVEEVEALWLAPGGCKNDWKRLRVYSLKRNRAVMA